MLVPAAAPTPPHLCLPEAWDPLASSRARGRPAPTPAPAFLRILPRPAPTATCSHRLRAPTASACPESHRDGEGSSARGTKDSPPRRRRSVPCSPPRLLPVFISNRHWKGKHSYLLCYKVRTDRREKAPGTSENPALSFGPATVARASGGRLITLFVAHPRAADPLRGREAG